MEKYQAVVKKGRKVKLVGAAFHDIHEANADGERLQIKYPRYNVIIEIVK